MNCWHCRSELIWGGDFSFEDYGLEGDGIISNLSCPNCPTNVEVYYKIDNEDNDAREKSDAGLQRGIETEGYKKGSR
tara:strand:- start:65 stop:295 length:231 start_codon:yes stop_codon:yes gene_type:complete